MIAQRLGLRAARQLRAPAQRRLASSTPAKAGENAFLKEREDIKHHAHATTGEPNPTRPSVQREKD